MPPTKCKAFGSTPFAITTFGDIGPKTGEFINLVQQQTANPAGFKEQLLTAMTVSVQIGNSNMFDNK